MSVRSRRSSVSSTSSRASPALPPPLQTRASTAAALQQRSRSPQRRSVSPKAPRSVPTVSSADAPLGGTSQSGATSSIHPPNRLSGCFSLGGATGAAGSFSGRERYDHGGSWRPRQGLLGGESSSSSTSSRAPAAPPRLGGTRESGSSTLLPTSTAPSLSASATSSSTALRALPAGATTSTTSAAQPSSSRNGHRWTAYPNASSVAPSTTSAAPSTSAAAVAHTTSPSSKSTRFATTAHDFAIDPRMPPKYVSRLAGFSAAPSSSAVPSSSAAAAAAASSAAPSSVPASYPAAMSTSAVPTSRNVPAMTPNMPAPSTARASQSRPKRRADEMDDDWYDERYSPYVYSPDGYLYIPGSRYAEKRVRTSRRVRTPPPPSMPPPATQGPPQMPCGKPSSSTRRETYPPPATSAGTSTSLNATQQVRQPTAPSKSKPRPRASEPVPSSKSKGKQRESRDFTADVVEVDLDQQCPLCLTHLGDIDPIAREFHLAKCFDSVGSAAPSACAICDITFEDKLTDGERERHVDACCKAGQAQDRLVQFVCKEPAPEGECAICYDQFEPGVELARLSCMCLLHYECTRSWWDKGGKFCILHSKDGSKARLE